MKVNSNHPFLFSCYKCLPSRSLRLSLDEAKETGRDVVVGARSDSGRVSCAGRTEGNGGGVFGRARPLVTDFVFVSAANRLLLLRALTGRGGIGGGVADRLSDGVPAAALVLFI